MSAATAVRGEVRRYRVVRRRTADGTIRFAVFGGCVTCPVRARDCFGHETLMPWRWASEADAWRWVDAVTRRQLLLLEGSAARRARRHSGPTSQLCAEITGQERENR